MTNNHSDNQRGLTRIPRIRVRATRAVVRAFAIAVIGLGCLGVDALLPSDVSGSVALADEPAKKAKKPKVDAAAVYFGNASNFHKPAEVDTNAVWLEIDEYKQIIEDEIEPGSARYELLMEKASRRFTSAVRKAARAGRYDLVAKLGAVENVADVPNITQDVIDRL